jgi:hypothetical protein
MGLAIYTQVGGTPHSIDSIGDNPITTTHNGRIGGTVELLLYIRNDSPAFDATNISITPVDTPQVDGSDGFGVKLRAGSTKPTDTEWEALTFAAPVSMPDLTSTNTYAPFWYQITIPANIDVQTKTNIGLQVQFTKEVP